MTRKCGKRWLGAWDYHVCGRPKGHRGKHVCKLPRYNDNPKAADMPCGMSKVSR